MLELLEKDFHGSHNAISEIRANQTQIGTGSDFYQVEYKTLHMKLRLLYFATVDGFKEYLMAKMMNFRAKKYEYRDFWHQIFYLFCWSTLLHAMTPTLINNTTIIGFM